MPSAGNGVLRVGNLVKLFVNRVRVGANADPCCPPIFAQARICDGGELVDWWFSRNFDGTINTSLGPKSTPFFYKIDPDDGHTYYVTNDTDDCTHGTIESRVIEEVQSCCNCPPCADSTPSAFHLNSLTVTFADQFARANALTLPTAILTLSNPSFINDELSGTPLCMSYQKFTDQFGEVSCKWRGERDVTDAAAGAADVMRVNMDEAGMNAGPLESRGVVAEVVGATIAADLSKRASHFALVVTVGIDIRESGDPLALPTTFEITYFHTYEPVDPVSNCNEDLSLPNGPTEWVAYNPAVVPSGSDLYNWVFGADGINFARVIGGKNGTAELSPADGEYCGFVPKYRATLVGTTPYCDRHALGPYSYGGGDPTMDFVDDITIGSNLLPSALADILAYAGGDCIGSPDHTDNSGTATMDLNGTFLDGGSAQINIFNAGGPTTHWISKTKSVTCNDDLVGGYPRRLVLNYEPTATALFQTAYNFGQIILEMTNSP